STTSNGAGQPYAPRSLPEQQDPDRRPIGGTHRLKRTSSSPRGTDIVYSAGKGEAALDSQSPGDTDPTSVFTRFPLPHRRGNGGLGVMIGESGGGYRNRTGLHGFAIPHIRLKTLKGWVNAPCLFTARNQTLTGQT